MKMISRHTILFVLLLLILRGVAGNAVASSDHMSGDERFVDFGLLGFG